MHLPKTRAWKVALSLYTYVYFQFGNAQRSLRFPQFYISAAATAAALSPEFQLKFNLITERILSYYIAKVYMDELGIYKQSKPIMKSSRYRYTR